MENKTFEILNLFIISTFIIFSIIVFVFFLIFRFKKKQLAISNTLKIMQLNHDNQLLTYQIEIQENTFTEISREIHDNISLSLTLAKLNLNTLDLDKNHSLNEKINYSIDLISKSLVDLNNLSKSLDGDLIEKFGLIAALQNEIAKINKIGTLHILFEIKGKDRYFEHHVELAIYRIIQEAIKNCMTHSKATTANVTIDFKEHSVLLEFSDNGIGFNTESQTNEKISSGIKNMNNRAKLINGKIEINSVVGSGTKIKLEIPIISLNEK